MPEKRVSEILYRGRVRALAERFASILLAGGLGAAILAMVFCP